MGSISSWSGLSKTVIESRSVDLGEGDCDSLSSNNDAACIVWMRITSVLSAEQPYRKD